MATGPKSRERHKPLNNRKKMNEANVDAVARFQAAFANGDGEALRDLVHPEFEVVQSRALPYGGTYRGVDGFFQFIDLFFKTWKIEEFDTDAQFYKAPNKAGFEEVVLMFHLVGAAAATGERIDTTLLELWKFREGKLAHAKPHWFEAPGKT